jgi:hypothetical protein
MQHKNYSFYYFLLLLFKKISQENVQKTLTGQKSIIFKQ